MDKSRNIHKNNTTKECFLRLRIANIKSIILTCTEQQKSRVLEKISYSIYYELAMILISLTDAFQISNKSDVQDSKREI